MSTWFRVHNDVLDNPKLILIAESDRWRYLGLLSLMSQGVLTKYEGEKLDRVISAKMRLTNSEWEETKRRLQEEELIDDKCHPIGWEDRQYASDSSAERTRKYRERKKKKQSDAGVTSQERHSDADVTPPDTDTDTDTDTDKNTIGDIPAGKSPRQPVPFKKIVDLYHEKLPELPRFEELTEARRGQLRQRHVNNLTSLENWGHFFDYIRQSDFLMGRVEPRPGSRPFRANLEWVTRHANYAKIKEGKYHNGRFLSASSNPRAS